MCCCLCVYLFVSRILLTKLLFVTMLQSYYLQDPINNHFAKEHSVAAGSLPSLIKCLVDNDIESRYLVFVDNLVSTASLAHQQ